MHTSTGLLFNHESPRRGYEFVTRKITAGVAAIAAGKAKTLKLGNLEAQRDWGHARDYVAAMYQMVQQAVPDDYVIATGRTHSVREFVELAFTHVGLEWRKYVETDADLYRPAEVELLIGNPAKAERELNWRHQVTFEELVKEMVESDCRSAGVQLGHSAVS
jgi:GDPmannose 4,6-dehydratase